MTTRRRRAAVTAAACALLALPAPSLAATTFGSRLDQEPATSGECISLATPCTLVSFIHPTDPDGALYTGGAPVDGVITKFRIRAFGAGDAPATVTFRLADIADRIRSTRRRRWQQLPDRSERDDSAHERRAKHPGARVPGRLPVQQGDHLAIDATNVWATVSNTGSQFSYVFAPALIAGEAARASNSATGELLVQVDVEPDADGDGSGDETQDQCPSQGTTQDPCDNDAPAVSGLRVARGRVRYRLNEASTVRFRIQRAAEGRRAGGKCRRETRRNRSRPRCTRYVALGARLSGTGNSGSNQRALPRRVGGRLRGAGRFRILMWARDDAGNETTRAKRFRLMSTRT